MKWDWSDFWGSQEALKWARQDLPGLIATVGRVHHRRVCVQAGGNLGIWPKKLAELFEVVYTFEPATALFPALVHNAPEANIRRFQAALGDGPQFVRTVQKRRHKKDRAPHEGITHISGAGDIPTLRVDDFGFEACDFLCLDVEGYELHALRGAVETLRRCRPVVQVEINRNIEYYGATGDDVRQFLLQHRYVHIDTQKSDEIFVPQESL